MAKDAKGHGSEKHDGSGGAGWNEFIDPRLRSSVANWNAKNAHALAASGVRAGGQPVASNAHAAATLASGPKSAAVETHPAMGGTAPFNREALSRTFNRNENANRHSANTVLLTKAFGTPTEHAMAREIVAARNKQGSLPSSTANVPHVLDWQYNINKKYYPKLVGNKS